MIEISRTQDEEVGDGTTSVIILAGEVMTLAEPFLQKGIHPTVIISGYRQALEDLVTTVKEKIAVSVDVTDREALIGYIQSSVQTKVNSNRYINKCVKRRVNKYTNRQMNQ